MVIPKENQPVTRSNVFETRPEQQQALIATALHRRTDSTRVVNDAQGQSAEELDRFRKKGREHLEALVPVSERSDPHVDEVVSLSERAGSSAESLTVRCILDKPEMREKGMSKTNVNENEQANVSAPPADQRPVAETETDWLLGSHRSLRASDAAICDRGAHRQQ
jgi:hypothetical protein